MFSGKKTIVAYIDYGEEDEGVNKEEDPLMAGVSTEDVGIFIFFYNEGA